MATSLKVSEKKKILVIICNSIPTRWCKDYENPSSGSWDTLALSEQVRYLKFLGPFRLKFPVLAGIQDFGLGRLTVRLPHINNSREEVAWCTEIQFP